MARSVKLLISPNNQTSLASELISPNASWTVSRKSIAVLPFENLSAGPEKHLFHDGIQEQILIRLSRIGDLKVISRASTQRFKGSSKNLPDFAKQLGVANILERTVQKAADQGGVNPGN